MLKLRKLVFCIDNHGAELENLKHALVEADSLLHKKHGSWRSELDQNRSQRHDRADRQEHGGRDGYVEKALEQHRPSLGGACVVGDERRVVKILERSLRVLE